MNHEQESFLEKCAGTLWIAKQRAGRNSLRGAPAQRRSFYSKYGLPHCPFSSTPPWGCLTCNCEAVDLAALSMHGLLVAENTHTTRRAHVSCISLNTSTENKGLYYYILWHDKYICIIIIYSIYSVLEQSYCFACCTSQRTLYGCITRPARMFALTYRVLPVHLFAFGGPGEIQRCIGWPVPNSRTFAGRLRRLIHKWADHQPPLTTICQSTSDLCL